MYTKSRSHRFAGSLRHAALALTVAGIAGGALAVPALAQDSVTTTRTTTYYGTAPATTYYAAPTTYYRTDGYGYDYPPPPAYGYIAPAPPVAGVAIGVPGFGVQLGF